jgi:hypothetical protein
VVDRSNPDGLRDEAKALLARAKPLVARVLFLGGDQAVLRPPVQMSDDAQEDAQRGEHDEPNGSSDTRSPR